MEEYLNLPYKRFLKLVSYLVDRKLKDKEFESIAVMYRCIDLQNRITIYNEEDGNKDELLKNIESVYGKEYFVLADTEIKVNKKFIDKHIKIDTFIDTNFKEFIV